MTEDRSTTSVFIYCDGGSRGNPGPAGIGAVVYADVNGRPGKILAEVSEFIGDATNNQAEYLALVAGLTAAKTVGAARVHIRADSQLVVRQVRGEYRVKHPNIRPLHAEALALLGEFAFWQAEHVRREKNVEADALVNAALDRVLKSPSGGTN